MEKNLEPVDPEISLRAFSISKIGEYNGDDLRKIPDTKLADMHLELEDYIEDLSDRLTSATGRANTLLSTALGLTLTAYITFFVAGMNWTVSDVLGAHPPKNPDAEMQNDVQAGGMIALEMAVIVLMISLIVWWTAGMRVEQTKRKELNKAREHMRIIKAEERRREDSSSQRDTFTTPNASVAKEEGTQTGLQKSEQSDHR